MWSGLVKIQYTELKLSWGNDPVIKNSINSNSDLDLWPNDPIWIGFFPFHRAIMWSSLVKIQYTELKLSCENDPVVKNYIYSNGDLDLWPNDPKINRALPLPQKNHVVKFVKDPIYRTKVIVRKRPCCQNYIYSNSDLWPNDPKINRALPLPQGNHVVKFGKDPIYRTKVIMRKRPYCQQLYL